jgi:hypothetical protein
MRIPKTFDLGGTQWTVTQVKDLDNLGVCQRDVHTILLRENVPKKIKEQTFCHELTHAIKFTLGEDAHDEQKVDVFATFLHQYLNSARYK